MEQNLNDNGLRKAIKASTSPRLSTNFTFRTMLKVQEAIRLKEQKQEKQSNNNLLSVIKKIKSKLWR